MRIYFVRHGESHGNTGTHTDEDSRDQLTDKGWEQAREIGKRLAGQPFSKIYVSPMQRTQETAAAISESVDAPLITDNDLHELIWFSGTDGSLKPAEARRLFDEHWESLAALPPGESVDGTESFSEMRGRVTRFLSKLEREPDDRAILVVTHAGFLRIMLAWVMLRDRFEPADVPNLIRNVETINTGVSEFTHDKRNGWQLATWMDQAHL